MPTPIITESEFGIAFGEKVKSFTIHFPEQLKISITNYGGIISELWVPDKTGKLEDVVLGCSSAEAYQEESPYLGAIIGRCGNRIAEGAFELDGKSYELPVNNGPNHLHGGERGFDKQIWQVEEVKSSEEEVNIVLSYTSKDGEEGYPGNLDTKVTYTVKPNGFYVQYEAVSDKKTVVNLTQHSYFNLSGKPDSSILDHQVQVLGSEIVAINENLIPTGQLMPVASTPFDFRELKPLGKEIEASHEQLQRAGGYDHTWVLKGGVTKEPRKIGAAYYPENGRFMEVLSTEPGVQLYTGNFLNGEVKGKDGASYPKRTGLCLETQHYPDSPNQANFPSVVIEAGEKYSSETAYLFSVK